MPVAAGGLAELYGELSQQVLLFEVAAGRGNLMAQGLRQREVLEQGNDVGKSLVKSEDVGIGLLAESAMQPVEQRMGRLWAMMSCDTAVKTTPPGRLLPGSVVDAVK
jgi:hypothetical protein